MSSQSKVKLISFDSGEFEVDLWVVQDLQFVMNTIEDVGQESPIFLPNVSSKIMKKVIEYYTYHVQSKPSTDEKPTISEDKIKYWDAEFVKVDHATLVGLINAANYLNMKNLLDVMCRRAANLIIGKSAEEARRTFGIANDFTPEEEKIRMENEWVFH